MWLCDPSNSWFTFSTSLSLPLHVRTLAIQIQNRFGSASTNSALNFVTPFRLIRRSHRSSFVPLSSRKPHFPAAAVSISSILFAHTEMHARLLLRMHAPISFAPASSPDAASFAPAAADVGGAVCLGYGIAIAVGVLVFISTVMLASYICVRAKAGAAAVLLADDDDDGGAPAASAVVVLGLDGPAIDALYPKFLHVGVGDDDNACAGAQCAICLGEFVAGDALRRGPGCGHRFHAECVERWLRVSATCPPYPPPTWSPHQPPHRRCRLASSAARSPPLPSTALTSSAVVPLPTASPPLPPRFLRHRALPPRSPPPLPPRSPRLGGASSPPLASSPPPHLASSAAFLSRALILPTRTPPRGRGEAAPSSSSPAAAASASRAAAPCPPPTTTRGRGKRRRAPHPPPPPPPRHAPRPLPLRVPRRR
ncbi:hypothetical protein EE612_057641 [Oryza sativa]|nr:hypothetical protein EE612_057641 [Oryza sativa]